MSVVGKCDGAGDLLLRWTELCEVTRNVIWKMKLVENGSKRSFVVVPSVTSTSTMVASSGSSSFSAVAASTSKFYVRASVVSNQNVTSTFILRSYVIRTVFW